MHFDHIQSTLFSIPSRSIPLPYSLNFVSSLFKFYILKDIWNSLCYLYILGWVVFHWSIDDLPKLIHWRLSLFPQQLSVANNSLGTGGISCPHPLSILGLGQSWVCAACMQVASLQMWVHVQFPFDHLLFLKIFYSTFPGPGEGQIIDLGVNIKQSLACCTLINCRSLYLSTTT